MSITDTEQTGQVGNGQTDSPAPADSKAPRKAKVEYTLEVVDALPERAVPNSPFEEALEQIIEIWGDENQRKQLLDENGDVKYVLIGRYDHATAAGAAANVLGQRHGKNPTVEGWDFAARRIDGGEKTGLFVRYDPSRVVPGAKEAWVKSESDRKAKLAKARDERKAAEAAKAAGGTGTEGQNTGTGNAPAPTGSIPPPPPIPQPTATPAPVPPPAPAQ